MLRLSAGAGGPLSPIMRSTPDLFSEFDVRIVEAGERADRLSDACRDIGKHTLDVGGPTRSLRNTLRLVAAVSVASLVIVGALGFKVVPMFEKMFLDFGSVLPAPTAICFAFFRTVRAAWWGLAPTVSALAAIVWRVSSVPDQSETLRRLPLSGTVLRLASEAAEASQVELLMRWELLPAAPVEPLVPERLDAANRAATRLTNVLEPLAMIILGGFVVWVLMSTYVPIHSDLQPCTGGPPTDPCSTNGNP
jgi:type II secretory pathway component PulF